MKRDAGLLLLLLIVVATSKQRTPRSRGDSGPWWPGDPNDNLGTYPVPPNAHPAPPAPPLK